MKNIFAIFFATLKNGPGETGTFKPCCLQEYGRKDKKKKLFKIKLQINFTYLFFSGVDFK